MSRAFAQGVEMSLFKGFGKVVQAVRFGDWMVLLFFVLLILWSIRVLWFGSEGETVICLTPEGVTRFSLSESREVMLHGALGTTLVQISDGRARVLDSACPNKVCCRMGDISRSGQVIACLPNQVSIRIEGKVESEQDSPDAITR